MCNKQIERLKDNDLGFYALPKEDREFMGRIIKKKSRDIVTRTDHEWQGKKDKTLFEGNIYRIHRNYTPISDVPVFEGYVLKEVTKNDLGELVFENRNSNKMGIDFVARYGCCGYNFKEAPNKLWDSPSAFVHDVQGLTNEVSTESLKNGWKPATLKYVAFPDKDGVE